MFSENLLLIGQPNSQSALYYMVSTSATANLRSGAMGRLSARAYLRAEFLCIAQIPRFPTDDQATAPLASSNASRKALGAV